MHKKTFFVHANISICMLAVTSNETAHWKLGHKLPLAFMNMCRPLSFSTWHSNVLLSSSTGEKASHYQQPREIRNIWEKLIWIQRFSALASFSHDSILKNKPGRSFYPSLLLEMDLCILTTTSKKDFCTALPLSCTGLYMVRRTGWLSHSNYKGLQFVKRCFSATRLKRACRYLCLFTDAPHQH